MWFESFLGKHRNFISNFVITLLFLSCVYFLFIDFTYAGCINIGFLLSETSWLESTFADIGFVRDNALKLIEGSFGVVLTMVTVVLNLGTSLFNRSERKVFGINCGDLQSDEPVMFKVFQKAGFLYPLLSIVAINLEFCGTSYMMLMCSYLLVYCNFLSLKKSYDKQWQREAVASKLLESVGCEEFVIDSNLIEFDSMLENVRNGILETEGWNNGWQFFDAFLEKVKKRDKESCFVLLCHYWEIVFSVDSKKSVHEQLIYIKKYISQVGIADDGSLIEDIVLWSLLCSVMLQWDQMTMISFLEWFANIAVRSGQRISTGLGGLSINDIQKQSGIILFILEYWLNTKDEDMYINYECVNKLYEYGSIFLRSKDKEVEVNDLMDFFADLLERKQQVITKTIYKMFRILWVDIRFNYNNSLLVTKLKYEPWGIQ